MRVLNYVLLRFISIASEYQAFLYTCVSCVEVYITRLCRVL